MESENVFERDEMGNIQGPAIPAEFWQEIRASRWTYVFHFRHTDGFHFKVDYEKYEFEDMRTDLPKQNLVEYKLFQEPAINTDEWFKQRSLMDSYVSRFFGPVLRNRNEPTDISKVDYFTLVIPHEKLQAILNFIESFSLTQYKDFILYLIAKIEEVFISDVAFYDRPEERKRIKELPKQIEDFIKVLKWSLPDYRPDAVEQPELQSVVFNYNTVASIKITDYLLTSSLTQGAVNDLDKASRKNWEKQLKAMPSIYTPNQQPNEFRPRICKALHNFFKALGVFNFSNNNTTNKEIKAIARILNFALVPFRNNKNVEYDIDVDIANIIPMVNQYIKRKELSYNKSHLTVDEIKTDIALLEKYFDRELLRYGRPVFNQEEILQVLTITERFDCNALFPDLLYLFSCLKAKSNQLGHQFECCLNKEIENNEDYQSWQRMLEVLQGNDTLNELKFTTKRDNRELKFSESLSIGLVTQALKKFYEKNRFEFEVDFYESIVEHGASPGSFKLETTGRLHKPENRFFPKFTKACYRFLLEQFPPLETDFRPSDKYFTIIALLLQESYFLIRNQWPEDFLVEKVCSWYNLI